VTPWATPDRDTMRRIAFQLQRPGWRITSPASSDSSDSSDSSACLCVPGTRVGALAWRARRDGHATGLPPTPAWLDRLQELDPARVVFADDHAIWGP